MTATAALGATEAMARCGQLDVRVEQEIYRRVFKQTRTWGLVTQCYHDTECFLPLHAPRRYSTDIAIAFELAQDARLFERGYVLHRAREGRGDAAGWYVSKLGDDGRLEGFTGATSPQLAITLAVLELATKPTGAGSR